MGLYDKDWLKDKTGGTLVSETIKMILYPVLVSLASVYVSHVNRLTISGQIIVATSVSIVLAGIVWIVVEYRREQVGSKELLLDYNGRALIRKSKKKLYLVSGLIRPTMGS